MGRNYGRPGRIDLAHIEPPPAAHFGSERAGALLGFLAMAVILLGGLMLAGALAYELGARVERTAIAEGR